jgi:hypothetical protein
MMRTGLRPSLTVLALMGLMWGFSGCQRDAGATPYFPLEAGHHWTYRVTTATGEDTSGREDLVLRTLGQEDLPALEGGGGGGKAWRRRSDGGLDYWLRADDTGIYRIASKSDLDAEPQADKTPRFVLKAPFTVGTQWQSTTTPYLLTRNNEFPRELRYRHPNVVMTYQIEATDAAVTTPAGDFKNCLRVRGTASVRIYADPATGWRDMPLVTQEWYCQNVGLVKLERSEPAQTAFLNGGTRTLELMSWD